MYLNNLFKQIKNKNLTMVITNKRK